MSSHFESPVEQIKEKIKIQDLIGESLTVTGRGHTLTTKEHDSLKIFTKTGTWHQFSSGEGGDIFDWWMREKRCDFRIALEELAAKAGVELRQVSEEERAAIVEKRSEQQRRWQILEIAATYYQEQLALHPEATLYCVSRGWDEETIRRERIGYCPEMGEGSGDNNALSPQGLASRLRDAGLLSHPLAKAVLSVPGRMLVYVHSDRGRVVYLSGRTIDDEKRHYNLPREFADGKHFYQNSPTKNKRGVRVCVEGQADAISLGQWGIESVALCGANASDVGEFSHIALDNDKAGMDNALALALGVDPRCRVVGWPKNLRSKQDGHGFADIKDANDILKKSDATAEDVAKMLENAPIALVELARVAGNCKDKDERQALLDQLCTIYTGLDEFVAADLTPEIGKHIGGVGQLKRLVSGYKQRQESQEGEASEIHKISAGGYIGGYLFEQCVEPMANGELHSYYWIRKPDGSFAKANSVVIGNTSYWPVDARDEELILGGDVLFATDRMESGSEQELLRAIRSFIHRWLDVPAYYENIASYYVLLTWFYDAGYETIPYLRALGEYGSGKTRFIKTIGYQCFRPMIFGGGDSEATLYYTMEMFKGTMVVDESDFKSSDEAALVAKIINMGNQRQGSIKRLESRPDNSGYKIKRFAVFGPKIFGARNSFGDQASDSRCLTHYTTAMQVRPDIPGDLTEEFYIEAQQMRNRLLDFRMKHWKPVKVDPNNFDRSIMPRLAQITLALKSIIHDPIVLGELERFVRLYNQSLMSDRQASDPAIIVEALVNVRYPKPTMVKMELDWSIRNIAEIAQKLANSLDPDLKFTPRKVGTILSKQLGLYRRGGRDNSGRQTVIVDDVELVGLMNRYGIDAPDWANH